MTIVELYSKDDCSLCDDARALLEKLQKELPFKVREVHLTESDPLFERYRTKFPVVVIGQAELSGKISEETLRSLLDPGPPTALFYFSKFLEALGMITVLFGFVYGLLGDMWTDLYFFLGGIAVFVIGRVLEKSDAKRREARKLREQTKFTQQRNPSHPH